MPVVTVSWELGSEGDRMAEALAERLDARLVDGAALFDAARQYDVPGVRPSAPELAERPPSFLERLNEERRRYAVLLRAVIYHFAAEDNCVVLGHGGGMLLRDVRHVVKVRTLAPHDVRVERVQGAEPRASAPTRARAEELIRRSDRDRARYIRYLFNIDWADPTPYDLIINTRALTTAAAVELLTGLTARPEFRPSADSERVLGDLALASRTEAVLIHDPDVWVENLRVAAHGGEVTLTGQVLAEEDRDAAETVARRMTGVRGVRNEIAVQPPPLAGM